MRQGKKGIAFRKRFNSVIQIKFCCNNFCLQVNLVHCCEFNFLVGGDDIVLNLLFIILRVDLIKIGGFIGRHKQRLRRLDIFNISFKQTSRLSNRLLS